MLWLISSDARTVVRAFSCRQREKRTYPQVFRAFLVELPVKLERLMGNNTFALGGGVFVSHFGKGFLLFVPFNRDGLNS